MTKQELEQNIKETKELIAYSKKHMQGEGVNELKEDLIYYVNKLKGVE